MKAKLFVLSVVVFCVSQLPFDLWADTNSASFNDTWGQMTSTLMAGLETNITVVAGANYNEDTHQLGSELLFAYNLPKMDLPLQPYVVPLVGFIQTGHNFWGFNGTASINTDWHPLRIFDGGSTNNFVHNFTITPNLCAGVGTDISGSQFGLLKVPGKLPADGQGVAAITGYGVTITLAHTAHWNIYGWFERTKWTTMTGDLDAGGLAFSFSR